MAQRQYEAATVLNARIVDMRHLWHPSTTFQGKPTTKPNYFAMFIVRKTVAAWHAEPALAGIAQACGKLYEKAPHIISWPIVDGDLPNPEGKSSEYAKGHWLFSASSGNPPNVEIVQPGGALVKLSNKIGVKSGDYVMAGVTAAVKQTDARGVKLYLNAVVFSGPGEEIVFANSVSGADLMQQARQQGLNVTGFGPAPGGFTPQPLGSVQMGAPGFPAGPAFGPQPSTAPTGGFAPAPAQGQYPTAGSGFATFPSNPPPGPFRQ
jgi:hypothetical protein